MTLPMKSNAALTEDVQSPNSKEPEIIQEYKNLQDKCEAVLDKINKRKKNIKKSKK